jgi:predicted PilT family ATPase
MSVVTSIIEAFKRKKNPMEIENPPTNYTAINEALATAESNHPVLQQLKAQIANLETKVAEAEQRTRDVRQQKWTYEEKVKSVLIEAHEEHDKETIEFIAEKLGITLTVSKKYEVNVTFTIDVEHELGEEIDPDWDLEYTVSHSDLIDYSADVIWSKDIS